MSIEETTGTATSAGTASAGVVQATLVAVKTNKTTMAVIRIPILCFGVFHALFLFIIDVTSYTLKVDTHSTPFAI